MTFDLISGLHMQIQTWHPPLWLCTHAKYYVKSGLTNVFKNANKTKNMHLFRFGLPTKRLIQFSCDNIALLKATLGSLTESFVQQNNIHTKLDQVLTRFHKLDKAKLPSNGRLNRRFYNKTEYETEKNSYKCT